MPLILRTDNTVESLRPTVLSSSLLLLEAAPLLLLQTDYIIFGFTVAFSLLGFFFSRLLVYSSLPHIYCVLFPVGRKMRIYILGLILAL